MAKRQASPENPYLPLGGSSRRYRNAYTGHEISRERYEREFGSLKKRGARSFKQATSRESIEARQARPARGRPGKRTSYGGPEKLRRVDTVIGRISRDVIIPFDTYFNGNVGDYYDEVEAYRHTYDEAIKNIVANRKIVAASIRVNKTHGIKDWPVTVINTTQKHSLPPFDEFVSILVELLYEDDYTETMVFTVRFDEKYHKKAIAPKARKAKLRVSRKPTT